MAPKATFQDKSGVGVVFFINYPCTHNSQVHTHMVAAAIVLDDELLDTKPGLAMLDFLWDAGFNDGYNLAV